MIRPDLMASPDALARFRREARTAARLSHPGVVNVYDFGVADDERAYLVMELLKGRSLREELRERGRLDSETALGILRGVSGAVALAHENGLLHRDIKPENIFLARSEHGQVAKILDFGLVKPLNPSATETAVARWRERSSERRPTCRRNSCAARRRPRHGTSGHWRSSRSKCSPAPTPSPVCGRPAERAGRRVAARSPCLDCHDARGRRPARSSNAPLRVMLAAPRVRPPVHRRTRGSHRLVVGSGVKHNLLASSCRLSGAGSSGPRPTGSTAEASQILHAFRGPEVASSAHT